MQQQCKWWIYLPPAAPPQALNTLPGHLSTLILLETKFWVFLGIRNIFDKIFYGKKVQIMFVNNGSSILIYFEHITYETKKSFSMTWKLERFKIATKKVFFFLSDKKLFTGIFLNLYVGKVSRLWEPDLQSLPYMSQMLYAGQSARPSVSFLSDF